VFKIPNRKIGSEKREKIEQLSNRNFPIRYIAKKTGTSPPTVRKYQDLMKKKKD